MITVVEANRDKLARPRHRCKQAYLRSGLESLICFSQTTHITGNLVMNSNQFTEPRSIKVKPINELLRCFVTPFLERCFKIQNNLTILHQCSESRCTMWAIN